MPKKQKEQKNSAQLTEGLKEAMEAATEANETKPRILPIPKPTELRAAQDSLNESAESDNTDTEVEQTVEKTESETTPDAPDATTPISQLSNQPERTQQNQVGEITEESTELLTDSEEKKKKIKTVRRLSTVDKIFFVQNIEVLLRAGFSLSSALTTVARQSKKQALIDLLNDIAEAVQAGKTFADALRKHEKMFGSLFINMVEAGELSGHLEQTLKELTVQLKRTHTLILKVRNAMAYPAIILTAMLLIGGGMMVFVIPNIVDLYKDTDVQLPLVTRIVIGTSEFIVNNGILSVVIAIVIVTIFSLLYKQPNIKFRVHTILLSIPIVGPIVREVNIARFARVFHSLITTDMSIVKGFTIIGNTLKNQAYAEHIRKGIAKVEKGTGISAILAENEKLFPPTVVEMISVAEQSGALDDMTLQLAEHFEEEVSSTLDGLSVIIEPILMLILGVAIGTIAIAVLWPMYNLVNVI